MCRELVLLSGYVQHFLAKKLTHFLNELRFGY